MKQSSKSRGKLSNLLLILVVASYMSAPVDLNVTT